MLTVFGSINLDLIFSVPSLPRPGETVLGPGYRIAPGGKGANQAVAAARDGARVALFGAVGGDAFAGPALAVLREAGVDLSGVATAARPTGCAAVLVDDAGGNLIAVAGGANAEVSAAQVPDAVLGPDVTLLLQMEVDPAQNAALIGRARRAGCRIVLNLAPAGAMPAEALAAIDVLIVNEVEASALAARLAVAAEAPIALARAIAARLDGVVVLTLGGAGAVAAGQGKAWRVGTLPIAPVDTTAAGDAFVGVLAAALDAGRPLPAALQRASVAAGIACLTLGAQPSLPGRAAIEARLSDIAPASEISG